MEDLKIIGRPGGVHIEARVVTTGRQPRHHVDIFVHGSDEALRGSGWITTLAGSGGCIASRSLFSQHGFRRNGIVRLAGVTLHSSDPRDVGTQVITEAESSTGVVHVTAESLNGMSVRLEGIGTVRALLSSTLT